MFALGTSRLPILSEAPKIEEVAHQNSAEATMSGKISAGFKTFRFTGGRVGGRTGRGSRFDPALAEDLLR